MSNTLKLGNGKWATGKDTLLSFSDTNNNIKPLPFSFSRNSSATVVNKDGLIETVGSGEPRIDFKDNTKGALKLEPTRSNLIPYSQDFSNAAWGYQNVTVNSNQIIAPDGTLTADKITDNSTNGAHRITDGNTTSSSGSFTYSIFLKKGTLTTAQIQVFNAATASSANVDLVNGTITSDGQGVNHTIQNYGNDWFKCSISGTLSNTTTTVYLYLKQKPSYIGNGDYLYAWGAQLEQGSYATSYIPTSGSAVTRVKDTCLKDDINTSIINSSYPFSMYVESTYIDGNSYVLSFSKRVVSNNYYVISITGNNEVLLDARANGSTELIQSGVTLVDGQKFKVAITMESATSGKICVNGNTVVSKTNFSNQAVNDQINDLLLGQLRVPSDTGDRLPLSDVKLYNTALTDQELIALTTI